jgi:hypothetical protein
MKHIKTFENTDSEPQNPIIPLGDYSTEDKIKFFDKMYKFANDHVEEVKREKYKDDDTDHWFFEEGFKILNLKDSKSLWN